MVARLDVDVSGPKSRPSGRTWWFSSSCTTPGCTRAHFSSRFTSSTPFMYREKSRTSARFTVCPVSEVPPPRERNGTPCFCDSASAARTSSASRGMTTPTGSIWYIDASVE
jgi:hypothetical protein